MTSFPPSYLSSPPPPPPADQQHSILWPECASHLHSAHIVVAFPMLNNNHHHHHRAPLQRISNSAKGGWRRRCCRRRRRNRLEDCVPFPQQRYISPCLALLLMCLWEQGRRHISSHRTHHGVDTGRGRGGLLWEKKWMWILHLTRPHSSFLEAGRIKQVLLPGRVFVCLHYQLMLGLRWD